MNVNTKPPNLTKGQAQEMLKEVWSLICRDQTEEVIERLKAHPWLMSERAPKDVIEREGLPFLHAAFLLLKPELAAFGIAHGAPMEDRCPLGHSALSALLSCHSMKYGKDIEQYRQLVAPMLAAGARLDNIDNAERPVWLEALNQPMDLWKTLIDKDTPLDFMLPDGHSGLALMAGRPQDKEKVMHLLRFGADVNLVDRKDIGKTPLMRALLIRNTALADFLFENGANVHMKDGLKRGFLHHVYDKTSATWLIKNGIEVDAVDAHGKTPLLHALRAIATKSALNAKGGLEHSAMAMIVAGADLDARDYQDTSPSAREIIESSPKAFGALNHMLRSMDARKVAMASLAEITGAGLSTPSP